MLESTFEAKLTCYNDFQTVFMLPVDIQIEKSSRQLEIVIISIS